jgi:hypothetical protein
MYSTLVVLQGVAILHLPPPAYGVLPVFFYSLCDGVCYVFCCTAGRCHSAPASSSLLSCSWHEIEPLADDEAAQQDAAARRSRSNGQMYRSGSGLVGMAQAQATAAGGSVGGVYSYDGDFYGSGRVSRVSSFSESSSSSSGSRQQLLQQQQQQRAVAPALPPQPQQQQLPISTSASVGDRLTATSNPTQASDVSRGAASPAQSAAARSPLVAPNGVPSSPTSSFFDLQWWQQKLWGPRRQQQQQLQRPALPAAAAAAAAVGPDAFSFYDLSELMLLGQAAPGDCGRALRRVVDRLDLHQDD